MKPKQITQKLTLNKSTVANLESQEQSAIRGGYLNTNMNTNCYTWCGACYTLHSCTGTCVYTCYCSGTPKCIEV